MELDKRIKEGKRPLTCFEANQAKFFIGEKCYLTNDISLFSDLDVFKDIEGCKSVPNEYDGIINTLSDIDTEISMVFETTYLRWKFCIPCEWVKEPEKKYRAFTIKEFQQKYSVGSVFQIRQKQNRFTESVVQYVGYKKYEERIYLGITDFTFDELFENFEMIEPQNDTWHPFGIIDE